MDNIGFDQWRAEFYANRVLCALRHITDIVQHMNRSGGFPHTEVQELETLQENLRAIYGLIVQLPVMHGYSYRLQVESSSGPGRPRYVIPSEQLSCLRREFNSWTQIVADLGVSRQTIDNRRREVGFSLVFEGYSNIPGTDLDNLVRDELNAFPQTGKTNVMAGLRQRAIDVQRWRVREAIVRLDPINHANRWGQRIVRRPYSVPHPNFLWHMDSNLKLRHWRMCIHGCIDGFSRCIIYLDVHNNNRASTVLTSFQRSTNEWGVPSRVRADNGGENVAVRDFMVFFRGENRGSFLTGPSTRNTRIERLWRDVVESVVTVFTSLFLFMEARHILDPTCERDMLALHYVFLPRVQRLLDRFTQRFNFHSVSTERNRTPRQLWASGCLRNFNSPNAGIRDVLDTDNSIPEDMDMYGHDPDAPLPDPQEDEEGVVIANIDFELSEEANAALTQNFTPLMEDNNYGIEIYLQVREFIARIIQEEQ